MTTFIKKAGLNLFEMTKSLADKLCNDGRFCDEVAQYALMTVVFSIMWLSIAQM